jgi:hypothetical protein
MKPLRLLTLVTALLLGACEDTRTVAGPPGLAGPQGPAGPPGLAPAEPT